MSVELRARLIRNNRTGFDPLVDAVLSSNTSPEYLLYAKALAINKSPVKRGYLEAALLACDDLPRICALLEMPLELCTMYRDVFYDVTGLDKLSKLELLDVPDQADKSMKTWALSQGLEFLSWRLGNLVEISPIEGLQDLFATCVYKSKECLFSGNASEASKEAVKWTKLSMDLARLLKMYVLDSAAAKSDLEMALKEVIPDFEGLDSLDYGMASLDSLK